MARKINKKNVPTGVKILAVLSYIGSALTLIIGIFGSIGMFVFNNSKENYGQFNLAFAVAFILLSILLFFIGRGLWKGQNWARVVTVVFSILGILGAISGLIQGHVINGIFNIIINGIIGYYLWFNKNVKKAFAS